MVPVRPLMLPMRADEVCLRQMQVAGLDSFFSKIGKALKKAVKGPLGIVRAIVAPITLPVTAAARAVTWVAGKAGIKPAAKASEFLRQELDKQAVIEGAHLAVGAVVGGAIAAGPAIAAAAAPAVAPVAKKVATDVATGMAANVVQSIVGGGGGGPTAVAVEDAGPVQAPQMITDQQRVLRAGMFDGPNLYVTIGGAMALGLIAVALFGQKPAAAAAAAAVAPGPLSSLNRSRRRRVSQRRRRTS